MEYHSNLTDEQVEANLVAWHQGAVMVATCGFGLGIDAVVRWIIVWSFPDTLGTLLQYFGRGGRDGNGCSCLLVVSDGQVQRLDHRARQLVTTACLREVLHSDSVNAGVLCCFATPGCTWCSNCNEFIQQQQQAQQVGAHLAVTVEQQDWLEGSRQANLGRLHDARAIYFALRDISQDPALRYCVLCRLMRDELLDHALVQCPLVH